MKKAGMVESFVLLALSGFLLLETRSLPVGSLGAPQVGFMPLLLAIILACLSLIMLGQALIAPKDDHRHERMTWVAWKKTLMTLGALFVFALIFEYIGYILSTFFLVVFLMMAVQSQRWWMAITVASLSSLITYAVFTLLGVPLPAGLVDILSI
jgi:hypothetical protein